MNKVIVRISWVPTEQGGTNRFPLFEYSTAAHFHADEADQHWSIVLKIIENREHDETIGYLTFMFDEMEHPELVFVGSTFELYESKKIADGVIIEC